MDKDYVYCTNCGSKELKSNKKCSACKNKLNDKDHEFLDYLKGKLKDKVTGDSYDKVDVWIKAFVKKYCYSFVLTIAVIGTGVTIVNKNNHKTSYTINNNIETKELDVLSYTKGCWINDNEYFKASFDGDVYMFAAVDQDFLNPEFFDGNLTDDYYHHSYMYEYHPIKKDGKYYMAGYDYIDEETGEKIGYRENEIIIKDLDTIGIPYRTYYTDEFGKFVELYEEIVLKRNKCE